MILNTFLIIFLIIFSTFVQKYYFIVLYKIKNFNVFFDYFFWFIIRFWVIIHEFCHMFFWFLSWNKIKEVQLFNKDWWKVIYETKNYIWALSEYWFSLWFIFSLILNQIWIFLTSFWPLFFWILITFLSLNYFWFTNFSDIKNFEYSFWFIVFLLIYSIFIPSFVLSFEDLKKFFVSKQEWIFSTLFWSIINIFIFVWFIYLISSFIINYLIFFCILFLIMFLFQIIIFLIFSLIKKIIK